jgi:hypothetical protein
MNPESGHFLRKWRGKKWICYWTITVGPWSSCIDSIIFFGADSPFLSDENLRTAYHSVLLALPSTVNFLFGLQGTFDTYFSVSWFYFMKPCKIRQLVFVFSFQGIQFAKFYQVSWPAVFSCRVKCVLTYSIKFNFMSLLKQIIIIIIILSS